nr:Unknown Function [uncultured bacterium]
MLTLWIETLLNNFAATMLVVSIIFMLVHKALVGGQLPEGEIVFRWTSLFALGFTSIFAAFFHLFFSQYASANIGWPPSPFEYEVAFADLALGVLGILAFKASYGFRLATVIAAIIMFWGDALVHTYQIFMYRNFAVGNAGTWFWMDIIIPVILLIALLKLKSGRWF